MQRETLFTDQETALYDYLVVINPGTQIAGEVRKVQRADSRNAGHFHQPLFQSAYLVIPLCIPGEVPG